VSGTGFGTQCSICGIWAYPGAVQLQVSSWADQAITAFLPASFNGYVQLVVRSSAGTGTVGTMAATMSSLSLSSSQLQFAYTIGGSPPASQSVSISSSTATTLSWSAASNAGWLIPGSQSGTTPATLTISVNTTALTPGPYTGAITVTATGASNSPQMISVHLTVLGQPPLIALSSTRANFAYTTGGTVPPAQQFALSNSGGGTLTWSAASNANWLSVSPPSGTATSTLTVVVIPSSLPPGPYSGVVTITASGASNSPQAITVTLTVSPAAPSVIVTSVTNSASSVSGPVAPGEIITIKGSGLGPSGGVSLAIDATTGLVASTLAGTRVLIGGYAAPITYASAGQINAIVPYELAGQSQVAMQVQYQAATSAGTTLQMASVAPAAFTLNATGSGQAAALNQDGSINGPSNPAPKSF